VIHLDTSFLVDLERELLVERPGSAMDWLETLDDGEVLGASVHVVCELRLGAELSRLAIEAHEHLDRILSGLLICYPDGRFAGQFARLAAATRRGGRAIGTMDLLIATAATLDDVALVTRNVRDFSRVPGLRVLEY
jgi:tRNA(fMet)-specific endonuclease VapC